MSSDNFPKPRRGYSSIQIVLHWLILLLVIVQFILGDGAVIAHMERSSGLAFSDNAHFAIWGHGVVGSLIFVLVIVRLVVRLRRGAPAIPRYISKSYHHFAGLVHGLFYWLLLGAPVIGVVGWFGFAPLLFWHTALAWVFATLIIIHMSAALIGQFVLRERGLAPMLRRDTSA